MSVQHSTIALVATQPHLEKAAAVAEQWGFSVATAAPDSGLYLHWDGERLTLCENGEAGPVVVDFVAGELGHRRRYGGGRGQPLARAVGLKGGHNPSVWDATAGLGRDAFVLASLGCTVTLVERSPVMAALLDDGLRRAREDEEIGSWVGERMRLLHGNAMTLLQELSAGERPEVIYLDPMFPPKQKSALVKKEMRMLQRLLHGECTDEAVLLATAVKVARCRVVVKRPDWAEPLEGRRPSAAVKGKRYRYDLYVNAPLGG